MRIIGKDGDEVTLIALPDEAISLGDFLIIEEGERRLLIQVCNLGYFDTPGLIEDLVKEEVVSTSLKGVEQDVMGMGRISRTIRDLRLATCKVRGTMTERGFSLDVSWVPTRTSSVVRLLSGSELMGILGVRGSDALVLGRRGDSFFPIIAESLDGSLNIITGRKGSGKSHLSKLLVKGLAERGAFVVVLDLNDEYRGLEESGVNAVVLEPGHSLRFSLQYLGERPVVSVLQNVLDLPGISLREFLRLWRYLHESNSLSMASLGEAIDRLRFNEHVKEALVSRYHTMYSSRIFTDVPSQGFRFETLRTGFKEGGAMIVSLGRLSPLVRRLAVEVVLSKLSDILENNLFEPVFLFAEEAHLYLRDTYWDDIVTRMRHLGIFTTFITNQPDALGDRIYRHADNTFIFNTVNTSDVELLSRVTSVDSKTLKVIVRSLGRGSCLCVGKITNGLPIVLQFPEADFPTLGRSKTFFPLTRLQSAKA